MLDQRARPTDIVCADSASPAWANLRVAVLVPCFNEALTIERVVHGFAAALPGSSIYVYDNASTDATAASALRAGAIVRSEPWPGKGNVVRRMFADVEADVYLIVDGDGTYDDSSAPLLVQRLVDEHLDMVVGVRGDIFTEAHRRGHAVGNRIFNMAFAQLFGRGFTDIFSGYRALSRRFVKSFPALSRGFEIETESYAEVGRLFEDLSRKIERAGGGFIRVQHRRGRPGMWHEVLETSYGRGRWHTQYREPQYEPHGRFEYRPHGYERHNQTGGKRTAKRSSNRAGTPKRSARTGRFVKAR